MTVVAGVSELDSAMQSVNPLIDKWTRYKGAKLVQMSHARAPILWKQVMGVTLVMYDLRIRFSH